MNESEKLRSEAAEWLKRADNRHGTMSNEVANTNLATGQLLASMARLMEAIERLESLGESQAIGDNP